MKWIMGMLVAGCAGLTGCYKAHTSDNSSQNSPSVAKLDNIIMLRKVDDGATNYTISYEDGRIAFGIDSNSIMLMVRSHGNTEMLDLTLNATNGMIDRTVFELTNGSRIIGNADGIPVKKYTAQLTPLNFKDGVFVPATNSDLKQ